MIDVNFEIKERVDKWSKYNGRLISKCTVDEEGYVNDANNIKKCRPVSALAMAACSRGRSS